MTDESTYTTDDPMIDETFNKQRSTESLPDAQVRPASLGRR